MLTVCGRIGPRFTSAEAELGGRHEIRPFVYLFELPKRVREYEPANRVSVAVCTVRVELASCITFWNVEHCHVSNSRYLDVVRGLHEVGPSDAAVRNHTRAVPVLEAPGYFKTLGIANG